MNLQRVRTVCISDTHGQTPHLPSGDILIHAGDLTQQGTAEELRKVLKWLEAAEFRLKIVVAGNHDACLDPGSRRRGGQDEAPVLQQLMRSSPTINYLEHDSRTLRLQNDDGTEVRFKVFGSPYIPARRPRAFGYSLEDGESRWKDIPLDADIVVTHTPAKYHLDESVASGAVGCPHLREALWRVRPKLFVCGHIHEGRGVEVVQWDLHSPNVKSKESGMSRIPDETGQSKKHFRVNLSSASTQPLRNDGSQGELVPCSLAGKLRGLEIDGNGAPAVVGRSTRAQGGSSCSSDAEAVLGREGRLETCIVNASYVPSTNLSRSHRAGRSFNKPVIVDLDFRVDGGAHECYANALLWSLTKSSC